MTWFFSSDIFLNVLVDLRGRFQTLKVQIGADGSLTYQCDTEPEHVARDSED
ncbi:MAG: hypothetical protein ABFS56_24150 [Pseudomonadota bacterium]